MLLETFLEELLVFMLWDRVLMAVDGGLEIELSIILAQSSICAGSYAEYLIVCLFKALISYYFTDF